jgi:hypothetical protein
LISDKEFFVRQSRFAATAILVVLVLMITTACAFTNVITQQLRGRATDAPPVRYYPEEDAVIPPQPASLKLQHRSKKHSPFMRRENGFNSRRSA